jgi:hypothetical protein
LGQSLAKSDLTFQSAWIYPRRERNECFARLKYWIKNPLPIEYGMAKNYLFQVIIAKQVVWAELGVTLPPNK